MSFDPEREVRSAREHLLKLAAAGPAWREYAIGRAESMAREDHGLWRPLASLAKELRSQPTTQRTRNVPA